jgi:hypothetical protein
MRTCLASLMALALGACTNFQEVHYFKTIDNSGNPVNFYRLTIKGDAGFSSANYVSGYYDEAAVDLLFNEQRSKAPPYVEITPPTVGPAPVPSNGDSKPAPTASGSPATENKPPVAERKPTAAPKAAGQNDASKDQFTVANSNQKGAFIMIFSTNADAVADTIGNFADSSITAQAISNLVNQSQLRTIQEASSQQDAVVRQATAASDELTALLRQVPAGPMPELTPTKEAYLRVLSAISRALGSPQNFQSLDEADAWFRAAQLSVGGQ